VNPTKIIIHHSLTEDTETVSWNAIKHYHIHACGWKDIGYHYGIELIGNEYTLLKGRMDNEAGAHCLGFNDSSISICMIGNFDHVSPCEAQLKVLRRIVNALMHIYGISVLDVIGHWETYALRNKYVEKSCPGNMFSMPKFRCTL